MRLPSSMTLAAVLGAIAAIAPGAFAQPAPAAPPPAPPPPAAPPPAAAPPAAAPAQPAPPAPAPAPAPPPPAAAPPPPPAAAQAPGVEPVPAPPTAAEPAAAALDEHAQSPAPEIGGHVEAAYHLNLTHPEAEDNVVGRSYDARGGNSFLLHAAHLVVKHAFTDAVSAVIEFDAGEDSFQNTALDGSLPDPSYVDIQEAYATYTAPFGLSFTAGKFVTYEGIEIVEGPLNPTITRGFLFGLAEPVNHVGAKLHYGIKDGDTEMVNLGIGVVNGWDRYVDNNDGKTLIFRVGVTPIPEFWAAASGTYGAEQADNNDDRRLSLDLTGAVIPHDMVTINFQVNYGAERDVPLAAGPTDASWVGFGLQPVIKVDGFSAGLRFEYFMDSDGARTGYGDEISVWNLTVTPGYTFDEKFQIRAEFRHDQASEEVFTGDLDAAGNRELEKGQQTIAAAVAYMF